MTNTSDIIKLLQKNNDQIVDVIQDDNAKLINEIAAVEKSFSKLKKAMNGKSIGKAVKLISDLEKSIIDMDKVARNGLNRYDKGRIDDLEDSKCFFRADISGLPSNDELVIKAKEQGLFEPVLIKDLYNDEKY